MPVAATLPGTKEIASSDLFYKGHIPGLDRLRGAAILMVLVYHGTVGRVPWTTSTSWTRWPLFAAQYGASGVHLFYVLSGFLITGILVDTVGKPGYYRKFYVRRALRILPAYILMLMVLKLDHIVSWRFVLAALLYVANMARLVGAHDSEYGALWSLAVEEQFYLIWPVVVRRCSLRSLTRMIVSYFVIAWLLRTVCLLRFPSTDIYYKLWFNADWLLSGALVAIALRRGMLRRANISLWIAILAAVALAVLPLSILLDLHPASRTMQPLWAFYRYPFVFAYLALLLTVIKTNQGPAALARASLPARVLAFYGYISYGLYLVHQLIFITYDRLVQGSQLEPSGSRPFAMLLELTAGIGISTVLAYLSRRFFEDLFLRRKDKIVPYRDANVNELPVSGPA